MLSDGQFVPAISRKKSMTNDQTPNVPTPVFRIDKFIVPAEVLPAFVAQMQRIQQTLRSLPGCVRNQVLTQIGGPGEFNVLTVVEWASEQAVATATSFVQKKFAEEGFDPADFVRRNGVRADLGFYRAA